MANPSISFSDVLKDILTGLQIAVAALPIILQYKQAFGSAVAQTAVDSLSSHLASNGINQTTVDTAKAVLTVPQDPQD